MIKSLRVIAIVVVVLMCTAGCVRQETGTSSQNSQSAVKEITGLNIGETGTSLNVEIKVTDAGLLETDGGSARKYFVDFSIRNIGLLKHELSADQRLHLLNAERERVVVDSLTDKDGADISGLIMKEGESVDVVAVFILPDDYVVKAFTYTFDIMGFGLLTYVL